MTKVDIPSAFQAFTTVQMLAPVAKYASGTVTTDLQPERRAGQEHDAAVPRAQRRRNASDARTSRCKNFPAMEKLVDVTKLQILDNPTHAGDQGRHFRSRTAACSPQPFDVKLGRHHA